MNTFRNFSPLGHSPNQFAIAPSSWGFANQMAPTVDLNYLFQLMQVMRSVQSQWGSFAGMAPTQGMNTPTQVSAPPVRSTAPFQPSRPTIGSTAPKEFDETAFRVNANERVIEQASSGWVRVIPEAHDHPLGLTMIRTDRPEGTRPVMETFDSSVSLQNMHVYHDIDTKRPYLNANSRYTMENYWTKARQADGLDYSALASTGPNQSSKYDYTPSEIRRIAIDATASEIFPGDYLAKNYNGPRKNKHESNLQRAYNRLNFFASKEEMAKGPEFMQNRHEGAKFAFAAANYKEHGGAFDDKALDNFLAQQLGVDEINSEVADGPRGLQLAKLSEVTKAISDGKVEIEDVIKAGVVPKDEAKKFEVSLKAIEHGEIRADVSKLKNDSSPAEVKKVLVDATKTRKADKENRKSLNLARQDSKVKAK